MNEGLKVYFKNEFTGDDGCQYIRPEHAKKITLGCKIDSNLLEKSYNYGNISANDCIVTKIAPPDISIIKKSDINKIEHVELIDREIRILSCKDFYIYHQFIDYLTSSTVLVAGDFKEVEDYLNGKCIKYIKI